jgi:hypothetical protein
MKNRHGISDDVKKRMSANAVETENRINEIRRMLAELKAEEENRRKFWKMRKFSLIWLGNFTKSLLTSPAQEFVI